LDRPRPLPRSSTDRAEPRVARGHPVEAPRRGGPTRGAAMIVVYLWIALALLGLYASHLNGIEAIRDFQAVESKTNGRRTIAVGNLRREVVRGLIQFDFLIIGIF